MSEQRRPKAIRQFLAGLATVPRGLGLVLRVGPIRRWAAAPAVISLLLLTGLLFLSFHHAKPLLEHFWAPGEGGEGWRSMLLGGAHWLGQALVTLVLSLASIVLTFLATLVAAEPFLDPLSEAVERWTGRALPEQRFSVRRWLGSLLALLRDLFVDIPLYLVGQAVVLVVALIPGAGPALTAVLGWLLAAVFAGLEVSGGPLARRGHHGLARWRAMRHNAPRFYGLGAGAMLLLLVPLAQLFTLPAAVVAGTLMVLDLDEAGLLPGQAPATKGPAAR